MDLVCIGHSGDSTDIDYLESLLNEGVYLSLDRYPGRPPRPGWEERNEAVRQLVERGWAERLMLGHDGWATAWVRAGEQGTTHPYAWTSPGRWNAEGMLHLSRVAIPQLLESGVTQDQIDTMMREVPRRFLEGRT